MPVFPGASETLCQAPGPECYGAKQTSTAWGANRMGTLSPPLTSEENQICAQCRDAFSLGKGKEHYDFNKRIQTFASGSADEMLFHGLTFIFLTCLVSQICCVFLGNRKI